MIKDAEEYIDGRGDHVFNGLQKHVLKGALTAYDKGQDERIREIASDIAWRKAAEWLKDHKRGSHDSLPKFDLHAAMQSRLDGENSYKILRAYHNGPEPKPAPDRPLEVGDKVKWNGIEGVINMTGCSDGTVKFKWTECPDEYCWVKPSRLTRVEG